MKTPVIAMLVLTATAVVAAPVPTMPVPGTASAPALSSIVHPPIQIASANVLDANGATIGTVQRVEVTPEGVPTHVAVTPAGKPGQIEVLDARAVAYDAARNQIITRRPG